MKHLFRFVPVVAMAALMCSCLEMKIQFLVKKDGSGSIVVENLINPAVMAGGMGMMMGGDGGVAPDPAQMKEQMKKEMMDEEKLKASAKDFGEGVTFKTVEFLERKNGFIGTKTTYAFEDLNKIKMEKTGENDNSGGKGGMAPPPTPMTFGFTKDPVPTITIVLQGDKEEEGEPEKKQPTEAEVNQQLGMMGMLLAGMKMTVAIEVEGTVTETDAKHLNEKKNTVLLMQMDFDKMLADRENLTKAVVESGDDPFAMSKFNVKGLKAQEIGKELKIKFK